MKVKCVKNHTRNNKSYDIKIGDDYFVLQIEFDSKDSAFSTLFDDFVQYRIIDMNGIMMPIPSNLFEIVDNRIPDNWIFNKVSADLFELMPKEFLNDGFLEDYYDGESYAVDLVNSQIKLLESGNNTNKG